MRTRDESGRTFAAAFVVQDWFALSEIRHDDAQLFEARVIGDWGRCGCGSIAQPGEDHHTLIGREERTHVNVGRRRLLIPGIARDRAKAIGEQPPHERQRVERRLGTVIGGDHTEVTVVVVADHRVRCAHVLELVPRNERHSRLRQQER